MNTRATICIQKMDSYVSEAYKQMQGQEVTICEYKEDYSYQTPAYLVKFDKPLRKLYTHGRQFNQFWIPAEDLITRKERKRCKA